MRLARLDNEVFFKKAFTDEIVFKAFVKDIVGIEVDPDKIETEKTFQPKLGNINFKYDIFAEDSKKRIVIEIEPARNPVFRWLKTKISRRLEMTAGWFVVSG